MNEHVLDAVLRIRQPALFAGDWRAKKNGPGLQASIDKEVAEAEAVIAAVLGATGEAATPEDVSEQGPYDLKWARWYARTYWHRGNEPETQVALTVLARALAKHDARTGTESEEPFYFDKATGTPCQRRGNVLCHNADPEHRHTATTPSVPDETRRCWCGGEVGFRIPADEQGLGCLENIYHDYAVPDGARETAFRVAEKVLRESAAALAAEAVEASIADDRPGDRGERLAAAFREAVTRLCVAAETNGLWGGVDPRDLRAALVAKYPQLVEGTDVEESTPEPGTLARETALREAQAAAWDHCILEFREGFLRSENFAQADRLREANPYRAALAAEGDR